MAMSPIDDLLNDLGTKLGDTEGAIADIMGADHENHFEELKAEQAEAERKKRQEEQEARDATLRLSLGANQILFTDVTKGVLPPSGINHVIDVFEDSHWDAADLPRIPKLDEDYYWEPSLLELMIIAEKTKERILLVGDPGTGKSSAADQFAHIKNMPYFQFNGKADAETSNFLGSRGAKAGTTIWNDGAVTEACKVGGLCCIDEVMKLPAGVQMGLQTLYQKNGFLVLDEKEGSYTDKLVIPRESFFMVLTDNVCGQGEKLDQFAGTTIQDTSTLDRVGYTAKVKYLPKEVETAILMKHWPKLNKKDVDVIIRFAGLVRRAYSKAEVGLTLSLRGMHSMCAAIDIGLPIDSAIKAAYINGLGEEDDVRAAEGFLSTVR